MAKSKNSGKLSRIKNNLGQEFASDAERVEYITGFYEQLYKKNLGEPESFENIIENFLGPDILNSDLVRNSKLTERERVGMEGPITLDELDSSLKKANFRSAAGMDGFSNTLIKSCWKFLRIPLSKYAQACYDKGSLTANFRGASIRLIPKKSDLACLKNWRPISLLSNMYKILSRALNERLNKIVNRICSRAQKGFNKSRYTQEVLINVWESIKNCHSSETNGAVMAVDMAKAFDTLSNKFLEEVFKFFGFGPVMRNWLKLIGNNRTACIILDNGNFSRNFLLERGRPQGDNISPNTFNFCIQILIFRLELDPRIKALPRIVPQLPAAEVPNVFSTESNRETSKNEGLAHDNTSLVLLDLASLTHIKAALDEFGNFSGLICNYDKSIIMPILPQDRGTIVEIESLGFSVADKITLL